jgi:hypothetical protein
MRIIRLKHTETGWTADFVGDDEIKSLFGTTVIPTAFTSLAPGPYVQAEIQRLNPDCLVVFSAV